MCFYPKNCFDPQNCSDPKSCFDAKNGFDSKNCFHPKILTKIVFCIYSMWTVIVPVVAIVVVAVVVVDGVVVLNVCWTKRIIVIPIHHLFLLDPSLDDGLPSSMTIMFRDVFLYNAPIQQRFLATHLRLLHLRNKRWLETNLSAYS